MAENNNSTIDDLRNPLLAALGAADLALAAANELVVSLRERAGEAAAGASARAEKTRERLYKLPEDLPAKYTHFVERGEAAVQRMRSRAAVKGNVAAAGAAQPASAPSDQG